jgi:hypothetical protein
VYFAMPEGMNWELFNCLNCSAVFLIDRENPFVGQRDAIELAGARECPACKAGLAATLASYPESFRKANGDLGHFKPGPLIPDDDETELVKIWVLEDPELRSSDQNLSGITVGADLTNCSGPSEPAPG